MIEAAWVDLRYAARSLIKNPLLTLVVTASLALGIGANSTIFSLANMLLLRPFPAQHPAELANVYTSESDGQRYGANSYPDYEAFRDRNDAFTALAAYAPLPISLTVDGHSQRVLGTLVSGNYFPMLGTAAAHGRTLLPSDDRPGAPPVVMVSDGLWKRRFGADPGLVGKPITLNGHAFVVAGVLPAGFRGAVMGVTPDLVVPFATTAIANPGSDRLDSRGGRWVMAIGRLRPGVEVGSAQLRMNAVMGQLASEFPQDSGRVATVVPEADARVYPRFRGPVIAFVALLMGVVGLVLLAACANVAGLLLARAAGRRREMGVRLALGASRGRITSQLLAESLLLGLLGGAAGLALAYWGTDLLLAFRPPLPIDITLDLQPDGRVLAFTLLISIATSVLFGLAPALEASRVEVSPALSDGAGGSLRRSRLRSGLVIGQVAISLLLLIGAGLMLRGLGRATALDPGFDIEHTLTLAYDLKLHGYNQARGEVFHRAIRERVAAVPGVRSVAIEEHLPLSLGWQQSGIGISGYTPPPNEHREIGNDVVSEGWFATMRIPILRGREFGAQDHPDGRGVAIVNEAFARRYWPGRDPLGERISIDREHWLDVVGVAATVKSRSLTEPPTPFFYLPLSQVYGPEMTLIARVDGSPAARLAAVRSAAASIDPSLPLFEVKTLKEHLGVTLFPARLVSSVLGAFGLLALLLAAIGLYGVVAFTVGQRTREVGLRMALGARPSDVLRLVVGQGMRLATFGMAIGLVAAALVTRLISSLLFGVSPNDPWTLIGITLLLGTTTAIACWIPARRASRVDPMVALRHD